MPAALMRYARSATLGCLSATCRASAASSRLPSHAAAQHRVATATRRSRSSTAPTPHELVPAQRRVGLPPGGLPDLPGVPAAHAIAGPAVRAPAAHRAPPRRYGRRNRSRSSSLRGPNRSASSIRAWHRSWVPRSAGRPHAQRPAREILDMTVSSQSRQGVVVSASAARHRRAGPGSAPGSSRHGPDRTDHPAGAVSRQGPQAPGRSGGHHTHPGTPGGGLVTTSSQGAARHLPGRTPDRSAQRTQRIRFIGTRCRGHVGLRSWPRFTSVHRGSVHR